VADVLARQFASQAILAALYERQKTGRGTHVEVSLLESLLFAMSFHSAAALATGTTPAHEGTGNSAIVPYQLLRCQDAQLAVAVPNDRIWQRFCHALGRPEWAGDERFRSNRSRVSNRDVLIGQIESVMSRRSSAEWIGILDRHEVPCGPLLTVSEIFQHPHMLARDNVAEVDHPTVGPLKLMRNPMRFVDRTLTYRPPPVLGQDTRKICPEIETEETAGQPSRYFS
jgi:formyl-CoA transferase/CoA:oxalate CoA-transferase